MSRTLTIEQAKQVWSVLVAQGATEDSERWRVDFIRTQVYGCVEYRFQGNLGFGGKFWNSGGKWYVTCYPEDATPERRSLISAVNECLAKLKETT
jgi:hypothetical protein